MEFQGRSYRNYIREDFQNNLNNVNWEPFYAIQDPSLLWEFMERVIIEQSDLMCPVKIYKVAAAREPWITNEAIEAIKDKDRLLKRARRTKSEVDWGNARVALNRVGRDLENLKADFLKEQQEAHRADPKKFWRVISSIIPGKKSKTGTIWLKDSQTGEDIDSEYVADYVNRYFTNIGPDLAKTFNKRWQYFGQALPDDIENFVTNIEEVRILCKEINPLKSLGMDKIPARLCKDAFLILGDQLVYMFNRSLETGIFPTKWKVAKIVPLYKGGDKQNVNNYRPVSLLSTPGKLLEKLVHKRIVQFWDEHNFLSKNQGGFRKGHSTVSTIADLTDALFQQVNLGNTTLAVFVDLRKAFDTVNTNILLAKLERGGIRNGVLKWCKNYLSDRKQCTITNGCKSKELSVTCGVPQGSVLGPLFFLVYVNDVENALDNCGIKLYADDTVLFQHGVNSIDAEAKLQLSLDKFKNWCDINALTINIAKTKVMSFASRSKVKKSKKVKIRVSGDTLKLVPPYKYLGLSLDSTLNFGQHIASIVKTISFKMTLLAKMKKILNDNVALQIYKSMLLPYFDYADVIFSRANARDLDRLQTLQNKSLKICLGRNRRFSTDQIHKQANVPFLSDRRTAHTLNFMYLQKSNKALLNNREIRTRAHDAPLFLVPIPRCEAFKRSVIYFGSTKWNDLVPDIRNIDSYVSFKYKQKVKMLEPLSRIEVIEAITLRLTPHLYA